MDAFNSILAVKLKLREIILNANPLKKVQTNATSGCDSFGKTEKLSFHMTGRTLVGVRMLFLCYLSKKGAAGAAMNKETINPMSPPAAAGKEMFIFTFPQRDSFSSVPVFLPPRGAAIKPQLSSFAHVGHRRVVRKLHLFQHPSIKLIF